MKKLNNLQGLRAFAFMGIFLGHCGIGKVGSMCVSVFLVLSGFLMVYNYYSKDNIQCGWTENIKFAVRKIRRLYPLHIIMICPMFIISLYGCVQEGEQCLELFRSIIPQLILNIFLIQSWIPARSFYFGYNGVAWYLSTCTFCYFVFPYILCQMKRCWTRRKSFMQIVCLFLVQLIIAICADYLEAKGMVINVAWLTYIFPLYRCGDFIIGCNLGWLFMQSAEIIKRVSYKRPTVFESVAIGILTLCYFIPQICDMPESMRNSVIYIPGVAVLIYIFAMDKGAISRIISKNIFVEIGNISGYTFLIHQVVINIMASINNHRYINHILAFVLTYCVAYVYMYCEKLISGRK